jgi:CIC family chloride channel protein
MMIANMSAFALARYWRNVPVYEALLAQDGICLPHGSNRAGPGGASTDIRANLTAEATEDATA